MSKRDTSKARCWLGTWNLKEKEDVILQDFLECIYKNTPGCTYVCGQVELGEKEQRYHVQYYLHFDSQQRLSAMKKICAQSHWEPVGRDNGASDYCMKEETRVEGPFEFGTKPVRRNKKRDLKALNKEIMRLGPMEACKEGLIDVRKYKLAYASIMLYKLMSAKLEPVPLESQYHWGETGTGKSMHCRLIFGKSLFIKSNDIWWDGYEGQETVLIEELGPSQISGHHLKIWADHYPFKAAIKGGQLLIRPLRIVITSNYQIHEVYPNVQDLEPLRRRFKVHEHVKFKLTN